MAAKHVNSTQLEELIHSKKHVLVDFWAPWCPHCRKITAAYDQIAEQYAGQLEVVKLDMDESDSLWDDLGVQLVPTIRLYENGEPVRFIVAPKTKEALDEFLSA